VRRSCVTTENDRGSRSGDAASWDRGYVVRLVALFCAGWAVIYADRTALYPLLQVIADEFRLSGARTGMITATYFTFYVTGQLCAGILADRFGIKRVLVWSGAVTMVGVLGFALAAADYPSLLLVAAVHGAGAGPYYAMAYSLLIQAAPARIRGMASRVINGGMSLGLIAGLAMAGPVYHGSGSWRIPFAILAIPTGLIAVLYQLLVRAGVRPERRPFPWRDLLSDRTLLCMNAAAFCVLYGWWVILSWGPVYFQTERGVGLTASGLYTLVVAVTAIPSGLLLGRWSDRIGRKPIIVVMLPIMAAVLAVIPHVGSRLGMLAALLAYGAVGKLAWDPLAIAWLGDYLAQERPHLLAPAVSLFSFVSVCSAVVGPPLTGLLRDVTGSLAGGFYVSAVVVLAGFALSLVPEDRSEHRRRG
jgi:MFS family permease